MKNEDLITSPKDAAVKALLGHDLGFQERLNGTLTLLMNSLINIIYTTSEASTA